MVGASFTLNCTPSAANPPVNTVSIEVDGSSVTSGDTLTVTYNILTIPSVQRSHSGNYSCNATNTRGSAVIYHNLLVVGVCVHVHVRVRVCVCVCVCVCVSSLECFRVYNASTVFYIPSTTTYTVCLLHFCSHSSLCAYNCSLMWSTYMCLTCLILSIYAEHILPHSPSPSHLPIQVPPVYLVM